MGQMTIMTTKIDLPANVRPVPDRHGKLRYRFRRKGWPSRYVQGEPGTAEFHRSYAEIIEAGPLESEPIRSPRAPNPRSVDDLIRLYKKSPKWKAKAAKTQHTQARIMERFADQLDRKDRRYGDRPIKHVTVAWLDKNFGAMSERPGAANNLRKILGVLFDQAIKAGWRTDNPVRLTDRFKDGDGFHDWTDAEIEQYRAAHPLGTMARLTMELALNTAARRSNLHRLERDHIVNGRILVDHVKDNNPTSVRMLATTRAALDALPAQPIRFLLTTVHGEPFSANGLGNRARKWCNEAGLPQCSLHGLRKALSRRLAEAGATDAEGMAVTGHKKAETFAYYRKAANRTDLSDRAMSNLEARAIVQPTGTPQDSDD